MREIKEIIVHHSATESIKMETALIGFSAYHKRKFHDYYLNNPAEGTPMNESMGLFISYHFLIDSDGNEKQTRQLKDIGYAASNWNANKEGIQICMIGNFDEYEPTTKQYKKLEEIILRLRKQFKNIDSVCAHRYYSQYKTCPGKLIPDEYINSLNYLKMTKENPAGANIQSVWLDRTQEHCVRLLTIIAEDDFNIEYDDEAVQNPQTYEESYGVFTKYMQNFIPPDCPIEIRSSKFWGSLRTLSQCLPLYQEINKSKDKTHKHICRWFRDVVTKEFNEIIKNMQIIVPEHNEK